MSIKDFDFNRPEIVEYEYKPLRNTFIFKTKFPEIPPNKGTLEYIFDCLKPYFKALNCPILDKHNLDSNIAYNEIVFYKHHIYLYLNAEKTIYLTFRHKEGLISDITLYNLAFSEAEEVILEEVKEEILDEKEEIIAKVSESMRIIMDKETTIEVQIPDFTPNSNFNGLDPPWSKDIFQEITHKKPPNSEVAHNIRYG